MLKGELYGAVVTHSYQDMNDIYIDPDLLDMAGILPNEKIRVVVNGCGRWYETYVTPHNKRGSREIHLKGNALNYLIGNIPKPYYKATITDYTVTIMAFVQLTPEEAVNWKPKVIYLSDNNAQADNLSYYY